MKAFTDWKSSPSHQISQTSYELLSNHWVQAVQSGMQQPETSCIYHCSQTHLRTCWIKTNSRSFWNMCDNDKFSSNIKLNHLRTQEECTWIEWNQQFTIANVGSRLCIQDSERGVLTRVNRLDLCDEGAHRVLRENHLSRHWTQESQKTGLNTKLLSPVFAVRTATKTCSKLQKFLWNLWWSDSHVHAMIGFWKSSRPLNKILNGLHARTKTPWTRSCRTYQTRKQATRDLHHQVHQVQDVTNLFSLLPQHGDRRHVKIEMGQGVYLSKILSLLAACVACDGGQQAQCASAWKSMISTIWHLHHTLLLSNCLQFSWPFHILSMCSSRWISTPQRVTSVSKTSIFRSKSYSLVHQQMTLYSYGARFSQIFTKNNLVCRFVVPSNLVLELGTPG